jgi:hypothetical protein
MHLWGSIFLCHFIITATMLHAFITQAGSITKGATAHSHIHHATIELHRSSPSNQATVPVSLVEHSVAGRHRAQAATAHLQPKNSKWGHILPTIHLYASSVSYMTSFKPTHVVVRDVSTAGAVDHLCVYGMSWSPHCSAADSSSTQAMHLLVWTSVGTASCYMQRLTHQPAAVTVDALACTPEQHRVAFAIVPAYHVVPKQPRPLLASCR